MISADRKEAAIQRIAHELDDAINPGIDPRWIAEAIVESMIDLFAKPKRDPKKDEPIAHVKQTDLHKVFCDRKITQRQWDAWLAAYPDSAWVIVEIRKA